LKKKEKKKGAFNSYADLRDAASLPQVVNVLPNLPDEFPVFRRGIDGK
jgi:hypothetical protein